LPNECNDDNWSTYYEAWNPNYTDCYLYVNYSIPSGTIESGCLWIKYTYDTQLYEENVSIPTDAFLESMLYFKYEEMWGTLNLYVYYNEDYQLLDTSSEGLIDRLYEESVTFNLSSWSTNQSMNVVDGEYPSCYQGYNYSTTLEAGSYTYTFYAYDGRNYNSSGPHNGPTVIYNTLDISVTPLSYDFGTINIGTTYLTDGYTFNITNNGLEAQITITVSDSQNWTFVNYSDHGTDTFCFNYSDDDWSTEQNLKVGGVNIDSDLDYAEYILFDIRLHSPKALSKMSSIETATITITATPT
jgi:hypothetical protein